MHRNQASVEREVADLVSVLRDSGARLAELLSDGGLTRLSEAALPELVLGLLEAGDRVSASATCLVARVHASGTPLPDGHVSVSRWLQMQAGVSSGAAAALVARGRAVLDDFGATREAWLSGEVTGDKVRVITTCSDRAVRALPEPFQGRRRVEAEAFLLERSARYTADELVKQGKHIRFVLDPDGADQAEIDGHDAQQLSFTRVGDGVQVSGYLTAETAAQIQTALDQVVEGWYRRGELPAEHRDPDGCDPDGCDPDDPRVQRARRLRRPHLDALALAELAGLATESGLLGGKHGALPRVTLTADLETLATVGGELHDPRFETPTALPPSAMLRILCDATVVTVLTSRGDGSGCGRREPEGLLREAGRAVLYVEREERTITRAQRAALSTIYPHCAFPGCRVPASRCRGHHVTHWSKGGRTDVDNLVMICHAHHHAVHHAGWQMRAVGTDPQAPGYWTFDPPARRPQP